MNPSRTNRRPGCRHWLGLATLVGAIALVTLGMQQAAAQATSRTGDRQFQPRRVLGVQPAIVHPPTLTVHEVRDQVVDNELVLGTVVAGQARAYPINMLTQRVGIMSFARAWRQFHPDSRPLSAEAARP